MKLSLQEALRAYGLLLDLVERLAAGLLHTIRHLGGRALNLIHHLAGGALHLVEDLTGRLLHPSGLVTRGGLWTPKGRAQVVASRPVEEHPPETEAHQRGGHWIRFDRGDNTLA